MPTWEDIFKDEGRVFHKPVEQMGVAIAELKRIDAKRVLDLGCGSGRHSVEIAKAGFDLHAADVSEEGLRQTEEWLTKLGLKAQYHHFSCYERFPFDDDYFDGIVSTQVIHHNYVDKIHGCISEMERVLRPGGFLFVSVAAKKSTGRRRRSKMIAPRTYRPIEGHEEGIPHYLYNMDLLRKDFSHFKITDLSKDAGHHYALFGFLKEK